MGKIHETTGTSMILGTYRGALFKKALFFFIGLAISVYFSAWHLTNAHGLYLCHGIVFLAHGLFRPFPF